MWFAFASRKLKIIIRKKKKREREGNSTGGSH
jgi:hypothetical protein